VRSTESQEKLTLVESAFDAWNRGDIERFAGHLAEDVAWLEVSGRPEEAQAERIGRDRLREGLQSLFEAWESYHAEVERVEDAGDVVVAVVREIARGRASGVEIDGRWGYLVSVEGGQIVRVEAYRDPAEAIKAAGLGESGIAT
jgi:ketosteroid isomerase-like protein